MPPRPPPSRIAAALNYLGRLRDRAGGLLNTVASTPGTLRPDEYQERFGLAGAPVPAPREVGEFVGGLGTNLADRARSAGGLAYEALTTDPNIGRMTTAEFSQAAADRAPTPRLDQAARDIGTIGRAIATQPVETGKAIVGGEIDRFKGAFASPQAAGEYAGSFVDPMRLAAALRHRVPISELDVYHGTPHTYAPTEANPLGEFDASKIGTGEGAQAYGHGIYLAERENVARDYAHNLTQRLPDRIKLDGTPVKGDDFFSRSLEDIALLGKQTALQKLDDNIRFNQNYAPEMAALYRSTREQIEKIDPASVSLNRGHLLKADLPDEMIDRMLDWDKPLSEQSGAVKTLLRKQGITGRSYEVQAIGDGPEGYLNTRFVFDSPFEARAELNKLRQQGYIARPYRDGMGKGKTGAEFAQELTDPVQNAERLRSMGIPGIKYLDAGSRGQGGSGTRNFVVFPGEEKKVRILERNGQPAPERIAQALEAAKPSKAQAKAGGEIAVSNGYFYKGGQFLPSTEATPGKWKIGKKTVTTGKELIAPGEFSVQPTPFSRSIYSGAGLRDYTVQTPEGLKIREGLRDALGNPVTPESKIRLGVKGVLGKEELTMQEFVDAYNKGQRWFDVQPDAPVTRTK